MPERLFSEACKDIKILENYFNYEINIRNLYQRKNNFEPGTHVTWPGFKD